MTLEEYSKEIGLYETMTLEELIESHRDLREEHRSFMTKRRDGFSEGYEHGKIVAIRAVEESSLHVSTLADMTITELSDFIEDHT